MKKSNALLQVLQDTDCQVLLVEKPQNIFYFTGFTGEDSCLYVSEKACYILTDSRYTLQAQQESDVEVIETNDIPRAVKELCPSGARVLVEDEYISYSRYGQFHEFADVSGAGDRIDLLRQVKTLAELERMMAAQQVTENAFAHVLDYIRPDVTEMDLVCELEYYIKKQGCGLSFNTIVAFGENSALPHAVPSMRRLQKGENVLIDFGARMDGYCSDMTRTVFLGQPGEEMRRIYEIVRRAQQRALEHIKAGNSLRQADAYARDVIAEAGYGACFGHSLGHGIGLECHEAPRVSPRAEGQLIAGTVITVEPGIYLPHVGGVRIENMCQVRPNSVFNLTKTENSLIII